MKEKNILYNFTNEDHRRRLNNIRFVEKTAERVQRKHLIANYIQGQFVWPSARFDEGNDEELLKMISENGVELVQLWEKVSQKDHKEGEHPDLWEMHLGEKMYRPHSKEKCDNFLKTAHKYGLKVIPYTSTNFYRVAASDFNPDWALPREADLCKVLAHCSAASPGWRERIIRQYAEILDEYEFDGIYIDAGYVRPSDYMRLEPYYLPEQKLCEDEVLAFDESTYHDGAMEDTLKKGAKAVEVKTVIDNTEKDRRMRVMFDTGIKTDIAKSAGHFYVDERSTVPAGDRYYPEMQTLPKGYYTTLEDEKGGFSFVDNCTCEYEATKDGKLAITLFRGVRNIICTEFRSAGMFPHEDGGQSLGELTFEYALYPFSENETGFLAERISAPIKAVQTSKGDGKEKNRKSFFEIPKELVLTAFKKAEDSENYIIRVYNPLGKEFCGAFYGQLKNAKAVNLNEEYKKDVDMNNIKVRPYEILTIEAEKNE